MLVGRKLYWELVTTGLVLGASVCKADTLKYSYVDSFRPETFSFELQSTPAVTPTLPLGTGFQTATTPITVNGQTAPGFLEFGTVDGGFYLQSGTVSGYLAGPVLFTSSLASPVLLTGTFQLFGALGGGGTSGTLTVTDVAPEPPSILLLGTSMVAMAALIYARTRQPVQ